MVIYLACKNILTTPLPEEKSTDEGVRDGFNILLYAHMFGVLACCAQPVPNVLHASSKAQTSFLAAWPCPGAAFSS